MPISRLETAEKLEQLTFLMEGFDIHVDVSLLQLDMVLTQKVI